MSKKKGLTKPTPKTAAKVVERSHTRLMGKLFDNRYNPSTNKISRPGMDEVKAANKPNNRVLRSSFRNYQPKPSHLKNFASGFLEGITKIKPLAVGAVVGDIMRPKPTASPEQSMINPNIKYKRTK